MNPCLTERALRSLLDGQLSDTEMSAVGHHLAECATCRQRADELTNVRELAWARGRRDSSSHGDVIIPQPLAAAPVDDDDMTRRYSTPDLERELAWLDPPRQEGDLGAMDAYRVLKVLGYGGMGIVLLCHDVTLERLAAVKVLRSDRSDSRSRARFVREARAAAAIRDDHVVAIHHVSNPADGLPYLVMPYIAGPTLRQQIDKVKRLPTREAAQIAQQVAHGLASAHAASLVHRDIKPANIILDENDGRAKIMDFGLVRLTTFEKGPRGSGVTLDGISPGTPEYMSPEQVDAPQTVDARTDVYGLGVTLYEMLTGCRPFQGPTHAVLQQVLHDEPRPPHRLNPRIPRELETICLHALEKEPSGRYESATAMADDLQRWLNGEAIHARPSGSVQRMWRWWKRHAAFANLAVATVILLVATGGAVGWQWQRAERHLADARLHRVQRDANAADALRHRRQRDAKAAEATRIRQQRDAKAAEAEVAKRQVQEAAGQMLAVALTTQLSQDTRPEAIERMVFEKLLLIPNAAIGQQGEPALRPRDAASALLLKGGLRRQLGDWAEAADAYRQATTSLEKLVADAPDDLNLRQMLTTAYQGFGEVLVTLQEPQQALDMYLLARRGQLQLVQAEPQALHYPLDLANSEIALGNLYRESGDADASGQMYACARRRLRHLQHATSASLDPRAQHGVGIAYRGLGDGVRRSGDVTTALYCYEQARSIGQRWVGQRPQDWSAQSELGEVHHQLGALWESAGDMAKAAAAYQEAIGLQRLVTQSTPLQKEPRGRLIRHLQAAATIQRTQGQLQFAIEAIEELQRLAPGNPLLIYWCAQQFAACHAALNRAATTGHSPRTHPAGLGDTLVGCTVSALRHASEVGCDRLHELEHAPEFDSVRETRPFQELLQAVASERP